MKEDSKGYKLYDSTHIALYKIQNGRNENRLIVASSLVMVGNVAYLNSWQKEIFSVT